MRHHIVVECSIAAVINPHDDKDVTFAVRLHLMDILDRAEAEKIDAWLRSLVTTHLHELQPGAKVVVDWADGPRKDKET